MDQKKRKSSKNKIHLGRLIQEKLNTSGYSVTEFAEKISLSRPAVYQMFNKQSIDSDLLIRISLLLKENFIKYMHQEVEEKLGEAKKTSHTEEKEKGKAEFLFSQCVIENIVSKYLLNQDKIIYNLEMIHHDLTSIKKLLITIQESET